jgi:hypothetical protein
MLRLLTFDFESEAREVPFSQAAVRTLPPPGDLTSFGTALSSYIDLDLQQLGIPDGRQPDAAAIAASQWLLKLHAASDQASARFGVPDTFRVDDDPATAFDPTRYPYSVIEWMASQRVVNAGSLAFLSSERIRVLPKARTPQVGITLRSLSHNIAAIRGSEVDVRWHLSRALCKDSQERVNLLLVPWPLRLDPSAFKMVAEPRWRGDADGFAAFDFVPRVATSVIETVRAALNIATSRCGQVHGVVLPEASIDDDDFRQLRVMLASHGNAVQLLLAGVRGPEMNAAHLALRPDDDQPALGGTSEWSTYRQDKHHRWCLDADQIYQYHLGAALDANKRIWENIRVQPRSLHFTCANGWLTICHLICEDLARVDPVAEVLRAVGPNLVMALLMDGPQLEQRWSARYASVLADDPGSSVLTLTSLGMALRSRIPGKPISRVVALWRDRKRGSQALALDPDASALLVTLCVEPTREWTADGRSRREAGLLVLSGVEQVVL